MTFRFFNRKEYIASENLNENAPRFFSKGHVTGTGLLPVSSSKYNLEDHS